jgi:hypothetical protein
MKWLLALFILVPSIALAGGDYVLGRVTELSGRDGVYSFRITSPTPLWGFESCHALEIHLRYARVPWYSWLPAVHSSHPSFKETEEAVAMLRTAQQTSQPILFGYMGYGLVRDVGSCTFKSKGLEVLRDSKPVIVLSYHNPV